MELMTNSALQQYINEIKKYPVLSNEEQKELTRLYKSGDKSARQKLINSNLRLVITVTSKFKDKLNSLEMIDIIQEGNLGLMRALETYDPSIYSFSTYAYNWIYQYIDRAIKNKNNNIRISVHLQEKRVKYIQLINEYERKSLPIPNDDELCKILNITKIMLKKINDSFNFFDISLNETIKDDEDSQIEDYIIDQDLGFLSIENEMDKTLLLLTLKDNLSPINYYILYHTILTDNKKTLDFIGKIFKTSRQRIHQLRETALKKTKKIMLDPHKYYINIKNKYNKKLENLDPEPIDPKNIIKYLYAKTYLTVPEEKLLWILLISKTKYSKEDLCNQIDCNELELSFIRKRLKDKLINIFKDKKKYQRFEETILKTKGIKIFDELKNNHTIDYYEIKNKYSNLAYEELIILFAEELKSLTQKEIELLKSYFAVPETQNISKSFVEKHINLELLGYNYKKIDLPKPLLYETLKKYSHEFTDEQHLYLECFYFNTKDKELFDKNYPNRKRSLSKVFLIEKLERLHFNINKFFENNFNLEKYIKVRFKLTEKQTKYLDLFYGYHCENLSIQEISEQFNEKYTKTHGIIRNARDHAINIYCNKTAKKEIDKNTYIPYILNQSYEFKDETRQILKMYIIENLLYKEIAKQTNLTQYRISNIITEAIRKIDFYRYHIIDNQIISQNDLDSFFEWTKAAFTDLDELIIRLKFLEYKSNEEISITCNISKEKITRTLTRFNKMYNKYLIKDIELNKEEIIKEFNKHFTEKILTEEESIVLALYLGIECTYNLNGKKHTANEISNMLGKTTDTIWHAYYNSIDKLKLHKINKYHNDLVYISRDELDKLLDDPFLPISDKEKNIICSLFELKGYIYKDLKTLSKEFKETEGSIRRRYHRSIVNIKKYLNNEIEGYITYETIKQHLNYFSKGDRILIKEFYQNNLTYENIAQKYKLTFNKVVEIFDRIKIFVYEITNNEETKKFDFDYYETAINNPKLPFYGNLELATQAFDLLVGQNSISRMPISEIKDKLNIETDTRTISRFIYNLMVSVEKLKLGIEKSESITYSQILDYYNNEDIDDAQRTSYQKYFKKMSNPKYRYSKYGRPTSDIIFDLIKKTNPRFISLDNLNREEVITLLNRRDIKLYKSIKLQLMSLFNIQGREIMSGKDYKHVYRILEKLEQMKSKEKPNKKALKLKS